MIQVCDRLSPWTSHRPIFQVLNWDFSFLIVKAYYYINVTVGCLKSGPGWTPALQQELSLSSPQKLYSFFEKYDSTSLVWGLLSSIFDMLHRQVRRHHGLHSNRALILNPRTSTRTFLSSTRIPNSAPSGLELSNVLNLMST